MYRRNRALQTTIGCFTLGCAGAAFAASGIPTLHEQPVRTNADSHALMQQVVHGLVGEAGGEFRFRHFADLFLTAEENEPVGGLATNITAAVFGQGETKPGIPVFGGGSPFASGMNGNGATFANGMTGSNGSAVAGRAPGGGGGGFSGGGGGGGGGGVVNGDLGEGDQAPQPNSGAAAGGSATSGNGNGKIVQFTDNPPNGNGHHDACCCCCCCPDVTWVHKVDTNDVFSGGPNGGANGGNTAAIPLPASLWIGMIGLAAVGWMRQRRVAV